MFKHAFEIHNMALEAVDKVVNDPVLLNMFGIHKNLWYAVKKSWDNEQGDLQGRFDFSWNLKLTDDTSTPTGRRLQNVAADKKTSWNPKLLEYNADTPSL
jgi:glutathionylspermidine synthase